MIKQFTLCLMLAILHEGNFRSSIGHFSVNIPVIASTKGCQSDIFCKTNCFIQYIASSYQVNRNGR